MSKYGILYLGSKDKIAESICLNLPKADHFYDLFGGGFAITHCMLKNRANHYKEFYYNEIKADVVDLVKRAVAGEFNYNRFKPEWISREDFFARKDKDAHVRLCWSFGNDQLAYLYSKKIEPYKRSMHQAVVFDEFDDLAFKVFGFKKWPQIVKTIKQKRVYLRQKIEHYGATKVPEFLHRYLSEQNKASLKRDSSLGEIQNLRQTEQLERLERLQRLQQFERLQKLMFSSMDYRDVPIKENSVVYCDPPYIGMADYGRHFNHEEFYEWAATRQFPVFVSEYSMPDPRLKKVYTIKKRPLYSSDKTVGDKDENLYWNGK